MNISTTPHQFPAAPYNFEALRESPVSNDAIIRIAFPNRLVAAHPETDRVTDILAQLPHANCLDSENTKQLLADFLFHKIALSFPPVPSHQNSDVQTMNARMSQSALRDFAHQMVNPDDPTPLTKRQIVQVLDKTNQLLDFAQARRAEQEAIGTHSILSSFSQQDLAKEKYYSEHPFLPMNQWRSFLRQSPGEIEREENLYFREWCDWLAETIAPHPTTILEYNPDHGVSVVERSMPYENVPTLLIPQAEREEFQQKAKQTYDALENSVQHDYEEEYGLEAAKEMTQFIFQDVDRSQPLTREILRTVIGRRSKKSSLEQSVQSLSRDISFAKDAAHKTSPTQPTALEIVRLAISLKTSQEVQHLYNALPEKVAATLVGSVAVGAFSELIGMALSEWNQESTVSANQELQDQLINTWPVPPELTDQQVTDKIIDNQKVQIDNFNQEIKHDNEAIIFWKNYRSSTSNPPDNTSYGHVISYPYSDNTTTHVKNEALIAYNFSTPGAPVNNESYVHSLEQSRNTLVASRDQLAATIAQETTENKILDQDFFEAAKAAFQDDRNEIIRNNALAAIINPKVIQEQACLLVESQIRSFLIHAISSYVLGLPISLNTMRSGYKVGIKLATVLSAHARAEAALPAKKFEESLKVLLAHKMSEEKAVEQNEATSRRLLKQAQLLETILQDLEENILTPFATVEEKEQETEQIIKRPQQLSEQEKQALATIATIRENLQLANKTHQDEFSQFANEVRGEQSDAERLEDRVTEIRENLRKLVATIEEPEVADALEAFFEYQAAARNSMRELLKKTAGDISEAYNTSLRELQTAVLAKEDLPVIPGAPNLRFRGVGDKEHRYKNSLIDEEHRQEIFSEKGNQELRTYLSHFITHYETEAQQAKEDFKKFQTYRRTHLPI
ncbi:MAG: hypothetical protein K2W97_03645 [Chthoniobacterales bacterium]|nr:hypothetical protein [Chthoniobacterales bacterium]